MRFCRRIADIRTVAVYRSPQTPKLSICILAVAVLLPAFAGATPDNDAKTKSKAEISAIVAKYVQASGAKSDATQGASMQVDITASLPKLKEQGRLQALRNVSKVGQITYRVLSFQGNNTVKSQVIARYLEADTQGHGKEDLSITPTNYKFKLKGEYRFGEKNAYLFQVSPRRKAVGLFKGEIWIDSATYLPIYEKGRLVKNPSIFFKKVVFDRSFSIQNGAAIPILMNSTIDTRLVGKVELAIHYSKPDENAPPAATDTGTAATQPELTH